MQEEERTSKGRREGEKLKEGGEERGRKQKGGGEEKRESVFMVFVYTHTVAHAQQHTHVHNGAVSTYTTSHNNTTYLLCCY